MSDVTSSRATFEAPAVPDGAVPMSRNRRRTELLMLVFVVVVVGFAYAATGLGLNGKIPASLLTYTAGFAVIMLIAHLAVRRLAPWADPLMLPLAALLNGLGVVMIWRLQEAGRNGIAGPQGGPLITLTASSATTQLIWSALGVAGFILVLLFIKQPRVLQRYTYTLGAAGLVLLAIPALLPSSLSSIQGAKVWIIVGGFEIQPGEFAKLALAVFFAGYLVAKRDVLALAGRRVLGIDLPRARDLGPVLIAWGASLLILIFETDIGTSALFFGLFVAMIYIATQRTSWLLIGFLLFLGGSYVASTLFSHVGARVTAWLHPFTIANLNCSIGQPHCVPSYQLAQGLYGLGFGGLFGTGLGHGQPFLTPLAQSDLIMTAFGEELGLTGLMAMLLLFGLLVQRGLRAAIAVKDPFAKLLAGGLAFVLALQVFIIVGGVTRLIPLTGITTPFLSQGGSSLVASWALIGMLMRISDTARKPAPQPIQDEGMTQVVRAQ
jgi:cell division protein FtsW (lipid II flippase)